MKKLFLVTSVFFVLSLSLYSQTIKVSNNGYIIASAPNSPFTLNPGWYMHLRGGDTSLTRWGYLEFPIQNISDQTKKVELQIYLESTETVNNLDFETNKVFVNIFGTQYSFDNTLTWNTKATPTNKNEFSYESRQLKNSDKNSWLILDVTDFVKSQKANKNTHVYFRLTGGSSTTSSFILKLRQAHFDAENPLGMYYPRLVISK